MPVSIDDLQKRRT